MRWANAMRAVWRWIKWPVIVLAAAYIVLVVWRTTVLIEQDVTAEAVAAIHANRLTREDVFGPLPVEPDSAENNATLSGVDVNNNGIRDDVERAIYFKYQASAKEAAPAYQYAKALQMEFTHVQNSETLVAVIQQQGRASLCLSDIDKKDEIRNWFYNTDARVKARDELLEKYMTSYGLPSSDFCDLDSESL